MKSVLNEQITKSEKVLGHHTRLSVADQLFMISANNQENRTYFHITKTYQVIKATAFRFTILADNL